MPALDPPLSSTRRAIERLPRHLRRYVVPQNYAAYTPRDQALWRHVMRRLSSRLATIAHPVYLEGLAATGIELERIPSLDQMNDRLGRFGWSAVAVRGFIPPAVFTELQSLRVLAIAEDIRDHRHVDYTPAPDIIHESAGHAPILAVPRYAEYLERCGEVGFRAIASREDEAVFDAIRNLSIVKEDPSRTPEDGARAERRLAEAQASRRYVSENTRASRLYWWTAEYGLVGRLDAPKLYGAGLLSSLGEAEHCLTPVVRKLPLGLECADTDYDITRMQPQLFVARDFDHLFEALDAFRETLAWRRGGDFGLGEALRAGTVNHLSLAGGLQVSGVVAALAPSQRPPGPDLSPSAARLRGPVQLARGGRALAAPFRGDALVLFGEGHLPERGAFSLTLPSGLRVEGVAEGGHEVRALRATLGDQTVAAADRMLVVLAPSLPSVAGGPADPASWDEHFGEQNPFGDGEGEAEARAKKAASLPRGAADLYERVRVLGRSGACDERTLDELRRKAAAYPDEWLLREEIDRLKAHLDPAA
ncbi:MAG TPA: aromatic amino acid hydroxylase [Polyangiaceae bacterium]|nr:aromatic amino acid hydroxylase [Polyangiaceae bacterium]